MSIEYKEHIWTISPTTQDCNSFFHAVFGVGEFDGSYTDKIASSRRMNWLNFLIYYETKPRPDWLKRLLQDYFIKRNWSIENDNDFKEYVKFCEQDRQILLDELPMLASLENVRIAVFSDDKTTPKIVEPNEKILADYPLANTNSLQTAVVFLDGPLYSKLTLQNSEMVQEEDDVPPVTKPQKRPPSLIGGYLYTINLMAIVLLNALKKHKIWRLSADDSRASYFDDLVLEWGTDNSAFLLQARFRRKSVSIADLLGNKYSGFSLSKYFFAYQTVKRNYKVSSVVLCTNVNIKFDWLIEYVNTSKLSEDNLLYYEDSGAVCYTFKSEVVPKLMDHFEKYDGPSVQKDLINEENVLNFLSNFQIISKYPAAKLLEQAIQNKIIQMGLADICDSADYARYLNTQMIEWYDDKSEYLTHLGAKAILCTIQSNKFQEKLRSFDLVLRPEKSNVAFGKRILHIVPLTDCTLSLLKVFQTLSEESYKTLFLSTKDSLYNQRLMTEAFEDTLFSYLVVYITSQVEDVQLLSDRIMHTLRAFTDKKVILIAQHNDELTGSLKFHNEDIFELIEDDVKFTDFTEKSQEQLLEKAIMFYEVSL